jgi:anti-sigma regulatory factor (Ser/Thr protein kinase)
MGPLEGMSAGERDEARHPLYDDPFEVAVSADRDGPAAARGAITSWLSGRVRARVLDDARLVVTELVTNSVRHAGLRAGDVVGVRAEVMGDALRVEVEDAGRAGSVVQRSPRPGVPGGFGLNIVEKLGVRWGVSVSGGSTVWVELSLSGAVRPGAAPS